MAAMSQQPTAPHGAEPSRPDASMSLLTTLMDHSLDEGYSQAAARREAGGGRELTRGTRAKLWLASGLLLTALVVTLGAAQAREAAPAVAKEREELVERIETGTTHTDQLEEELDVLRAEVAEQQRMALRDQSSAAGELVALLAGATPVQGAGLELVVDDSEDIAESGIDGPREGGGFSDTGRVRDRDLQRVVNGLWEAGAEAVAVNDQRLTSLSAIRAAGDAILVDNRPLVPPYTVLAVGDGENMRAAFQRTVDGQYLGVLKEKYGIRAKTTVQEEVRLPAAPSLTVRSAEPATMGEGSTT